MKKVLTQEQKDKYNKTKREKRAKSKGAEASIEKEREGSLRRMQKRRANLSEELKLVENKQARNRMQHRRANLSEEQKLVENEQARNRMQHRRANWSEEERTSKLESRKAYDSEYYQKRQAFRKAVTIGIVDTIMEENNTCTNVKAPPSQPSTPVMNRGTMNPFGATSQQPFTPVTNRTSMPSQVFVDGVPTSSVALTPLQLNKLITTPGGRKISAQMRETIAARRRRAELQDQERTAVLVELTRVNTELTRVNDERERSNQEHQRLDQWDDAFWQGDAMQYLDTVMEMESPIPQFRATEAAANDNVANTGNVAVSGQVYLQELFRQQAPSYHDRLQQEKTTATSILQNELTTCARKLSEASGETPGVCVARLQQTNGDPKAAEETEKEYAASYFEAYANVTLVESRLRGLDALGQGLQDYAYGDSFPACITIGDAKALSCMNLIRHLMTSFLCLDLDPIKIFLWSGVMSGGDVEQDIPIDHLTMVDNTLKSLGFHSHVNLSFKFSDGTEGEIVVAGQSIPEACKGCCAISNVLLNTTEIESLGIESPVNDPQDARPVFPKNLADLLAGHNKVAKIELCNWEISALTKFTPDTTIFFNNCGLESPADAFSISDHGGRKHKLSFGDKLPLDFEAAKVLVESGYVESLHYNSVLLRKVCDLKHALDLLSSAKERDGCSVTFGMISTQKICNAEVQLRCLQSELNGEEKGSHKYHAVAEEMNHVQEFIRLRQRDVFEKFEKYSIKEEVFGSGKLEDTYENEDETPTEEEKQASTNKGRWTIAVDKEGWKCETCMIFNTTHTSKCVACNAMNPSFVKPSFVKVSSSGKSKVPSIAFGFTETEMPQPDGSVPMALNDAKMPAVSSPAASTSDAAPKITFGFTETPKQDSTSVLKEWKARDDAAALASPFASLPSDSGLASPSARSGPGKKRRLIKKPGSIETSTEPPRETLTETPTEPPRRKSRQPTSVATTTSNVAATSVAATSRTRHRSAPAVAGVQTRSQRKRQKN